jgi:hypothetical protein
MKKLRYAVLALAGVAVVACQDLDVSNPNNPALTESLATPTNVETSIGSAFKYWHGGTMDQDVRQGVSLWTSMFLGGNADELTDMVGNVGWEFTMEPKQPIDHHDAGFWMNRIPWAVHYTAISTCKDVIETLDAGLKLGDINADYPQGRNTDRGRWFCTFVLGAAHGYLASMYDKVLIVEPGVVRDLYDTSFVTPDSAIQFSLATIQKAIDMAKASPDDATPLTWINQQSYTRNEMVQVMYSYKARIRAFGARNMAQRAAVNWARVIIEVDSGITTAFHPVAASPLAGRVAWCATSTTAACGGGFFVTSDRTITGTANNYRRWTSGTANNNARVAQRFLGPGDTTGAWQWWEAAPLSTPAAGGRKDTIYGSPDRRIHGATGITSNGRYFNRGGAPPSNLGSWVWSRYLHSRFGTSGNNAYRDSINTSLIRTEMDLLKAEAYINLGNPAAAVPLINNTRVGVRCIANVGGNPCTVPTTELGTYGGNLPPVTVAGVPASTPTAGCVPRKISGACGDLMDALMWEKRLESIGIDPIINWSDWRAWGKFITGTALAMPIHSRELFTLGIPYYTFGGSLPGSVGAPNTDYVRCAGC